MRARSCVYLSGVTVYWLQNVIKIVKKAALLDFKLYDFMRMQSLQLDPLKKLHVISNIHYLLIIMKPECDQKVRCFIFTFIFPSLYHTIENQIELYDTNKPNSRYYLLI